jgi:hypothetical protein
MPFGLMCFVELILGHSNMGAYIYFSMSTGGGLGMDSVPLGPNLVLGFGGGLWRGVTCSMVVGRHDVARCVGIGTQGWHGGVGW